MIVSMHMVVKFCMLTALQLWPQYWGLPSKKELAPPLDREGMPVQKYVPSNIYSHLV
jgi:hypothetical protein